MEKHPENTNRVQIPRAAYDGLEFIRRSGATNMLDRPMVLRLAREWGFPETADWIEWVDTGTYGRLTLSGPDVVEDDPTNQPIVRDDDNHDIGRTFPDRVEEDEVIDEIDDIDVTEMAMDHVREAMQDLLATLGKHAILTIADTHETQHMGVLVNPSRNNHIAAERNALIRNLGHASSLWMHLDEAMSEVHRAIGSLQYLIDPENN